MSPLVNYAPALPTARSRFRLERSGESYRILKHHKHVGRHHLVVHWCGVLAWHGQGRDKSCEATSCATKKYLSEKAGAGDSVRISAGMRGSPDDATSKRIALVLSGRSLAPLLTFRAPVSTLDRTNCS